jgi:hypothetical protein
VRTDEYLYYTTSERRSRGRVVLQMEHLVPTLAVARQDDPKGSRRVLKVCGLVG